MTIAAITGGIMARVRTLSRRSVLKIGGISAVAVGAGGALASNIAAMCDATPRQPVGPFYPVSDQADKNKDLTMVDGGTALASGTFLYLSGTVTDQNCQPVPRVVVEIWQACETGRYNHPGDEDNPGALDPNFQYWGIALTDSDGRYDFKTIIPGHYDAAPGWTRPPHIHFKLHKRGIRELITQMYFAGNPYNENDHILKGIPEDLRDSVVRTPLARQSENGRPAMDITFDIGVESLV